MDDEIDEAPPKKAGSKSNGTATANGAGGRSKAPMTEEEKRKNFLERNRQGNAHNRIIASNAILIVVDSRPQVPAA